MKRYFTILSKEITQNIKSIESNVMIEVIENALLHIYPKDNFILNRLVAKYSTSAETTAKAAPMIPKLVVRNIPVIRRNNEE